MIEVFDSLKIPSPPSDEQKEEQQRWLFPHRFDLVIYWQNEEDNEIDNSLLVQHGSKESKAELQKFKLEIKAPDGRTLLQGNLPTAQERKDYIIVLPFDGIPEPDDGKYQFEIYEEKSDDWLKIQSTTLTISCSNIEDILAEQ
ncbi:hypothetical protein VB780_25995 [Leptolyngbya sp. CCNP1308]|uniref:hypothetical protein n=1 Tax=Leptolyngbya sp. CCNP1308 TaxID=3110255 RepID=UPI002B1EF9CD|nr:hypothetical protein [Leptolyngbya sp. CCNP1308]MEA5452053.1 hypothetical protein [Leptolyngbya sp. CCNP1308]